MFGVWKATRTIADALTALPLSLEDLHVLQIFTEKRVCGWGMLLFLIRVELLSSSGNGCWR